MPSRYSYRRVIQAVNQSPWAILPAKLVVIRDLLIFRANGGRLTDEEIRERLDASEDSPDERFLEYHSASRTDSEDTKTPGVAILPLIGTIVPRGNIFTQSSGMTSVQGFQSMFRQAMANPNVGSVVIDVDSPGGQVDGIDELSTEIFQARGTKRIVAVTNTLAASAAYWIATSADEIVISPSGEVGSIGVFAMHQDISEALKEEGIAISLVSAGKYKVEGNPFEPLNEEARAAIQGRVDEYYDMFVSAVARNRGVSASTVRGGFGEGRVVGARDAVGLKMADQVATLDATVDRLLGDQQQRSARMFNKKPDSLSSPDNSSEKEKPMTTIEIDGREYSADELAQMLEQNQALRDGLKSSRIETAKSDALARGVAPAVVDLATQIMENCQPDAASTMTLTLPDDGVQAMGKAFNLFGAIEALLSITPGRITESKSSDSVPSPNPREAKIRSNPYQAEAEEDMTPEEAEEAARKRRKELGIGSKNGVLASLETN